MTRDDVIRMAREVGALVEEFMSNPPRPGLFYMDTEQLERFAALVAAGEREACAQLGMLTAINGIAVSASIRARGEQ